MSIILEVLKVTCESSTGAVLPGTGTERPSTASLLPGNPYPKRTFSWGQGFGMSAQLDYADAVSGGQTISRFTLLKSGSSKSPPWRWTIRSGTAATRMACLLV